MSVVLSSSPTDHIIDLDADPLVPHGWKAEVHQRGGGFKWDAARIQLYLDPGQRNGKWIKGHKLRKRLAGKPVLNANVLDYLLKNPQLIPDEWEGKMIFFWGTVYRGSDDRLAGRYLCWRRGRWGWSTDWLGRWGWSTAWRGRWGWSAAWLDGLFDRDDPAAVRAS